VGAFISQPDSNLSMQHQRKGGDWSPHKKTTWVEIEGGNQRKAVQFRHLLDLQ
jgi:hypothetical protein